MRWRDVEKRTTKGQVTFGGECLLLYKRKNVVDPALSGQPPLGTVCTLAVPLWCHDFALFDV